MNTAVGLSPILSRSISLCDNISLKFSRDANNLTFCLNTERIDPFVSDGAMIVLDALIAAALAGSLAAKYSLIYVDAPNFSSPIVVANEILLMLISSGLASSNSPKATPEK